MKLLLRISSAIAALALVVMMFASVIDVLSANLFKRPIIGVFDVVETMLVLIIFLGLPATFRDDTHIAVDIVDLFAAPSFLVRLKFAAQLLTVVFLFFLAWQMIVPALDAYKFGERKQELGLPLYVLWIPMFLGIAFSAVVALRALWVGHESTPSESES